MPTHATSLPAVRAEEDGGEEVKMKEEEEKDTCFLMARITNIKGAYACLFSCDHAP